MEEKVVRFRVLSVVCAVIVGVGDVIALVFGGLAVYHALAYLDMAKVTILAVIAPPGIMVGAYFVFGSVPTVLQLIGGGLILVGVTLILLQPLLARRHPAGA